MRTATSRDRGAYDMRHAAMGCAGSSRRAMAPGSSNPDHLRLAICPPHPRSPAAGEGGDGGWRRACNVGMMADMVGIEGRTYADPRYDAGMRSPPLPHVIASSRPKADAARRGSGRVGREGGRERRGEDGDE